MTDQPTGIDISSGNGPVNWQAAKAAGLDFMFCKAAEGNGYTNPLFASQWAAAKAAGIIRGAYLFFRWDVDPAAQAAHLLAVVGPDRGELPLTIDVENTGDGAGPHNYPVAEMLRRVRVCVDAIKTATGRAPILYTYPSMWGDTLGNPATFHDCPLWLAAYGPNQPRPVGGWGALTFWQDTDRAHEAGVSGSVDADVFVGSMDDLRAFAGITDSQAQFFPQTGHYLSHGFKVLWESYGARSLSTCGYPLTEEYGREDGFTCQDFENVIFEYSAATGPRIGAAVRALKYGH